LGLWMIAVHLVDGTVNFLADVPRQLLVARRGQALDKDIARRKLWSFSPGS
jgi:hypothetical protein